MLRQAPLIILATLLCFISAPAQAETGEQPAAPETAERLSPEAQERFLGQVRQKLSNLKSLQADFVQERRMAAFMDTLTAKGTCYFRAPDRIRWELKEPYRSALVFNKGKVAKFLYDHDRLRKLNPGSKEIMKEILKFISRWMQGDFDSSKEHFYMQVEKNDVFLVRLTPRATQMKDMIHAIELTVDGDYAHIKSVTIREARGDRIVITFLHEKRNVDLAEDLFALN